MKTLLWHGEAGEHPVHIPPHVSASGSSILFTCVHGCYLGSNTDETCRVVISELRGVYIQYINIYICILPALLQIVYWSTVVRV